MHNDYNITLPFFVIKNITNATPNEAINVHELNLPKFINLADPTFNQVSQVDMLLGTGIFFDLLSIGQIKLGSNMPILHKTKLRWIISGNISNTTNTHKKLCLVTTLELNTNIERF